MKDLIITVNATTGEARTSSPFVGFEGENNIHSLIFDFTDKKDFVEGTPYVDVATDTFKASIPMQTDTSNQLYRIPIKASLVSRTGEILVQLRVMDASREDVVIFKSELKHLKVRPSVFSDASIIDDYPSVSYVFLEVHPSLDVFPPEGNIYTIYYAEDTDKRYIWHNGEYVDILAGASVDVDQIKQDILDNKHAIEENRYNILEIAIKGTMIGGSPVVIEDGLDFPIVEGDFYGYTLGGQGSPEIEDPLVSSTLSKIGCEGVEENCDASLPVPLNLSENDRLVLKDSLAQIERADKFVSLTGDELWESAITSGGNGRIIRYKLKLSDAIQNLDFNEVKSNRFTFSPVISSDVGTSYISGGYLYLYPPKALDSVDLFKAWLKVNATQIQYKLAKPILEQIPTEDQVALAKLQTFKGTTTFTSDAGWIHIVYIADTKTYIDTAIATLNESIQELRTRNEEQDKENEMFLMTADSDNFKLDGNRLPAPLEQVAHVRVNKKFIDGDVTIEGLKEQPENPLAFDFRPEDMAEGGVMLKNNLIDDTTDWATKESLDFPLPYTDYVKGHKYYLYAECKYSTTSAFKPSYLNLYANVSSSVFVTQQSPVADQTYKLSIITDNLGTSRVRTYPYGGVADSKVYVKGVKLIDVTDLQARYPQFSDEELKTILDNSLPYISAGQSKILGGVCKLENLLREPTDSTLWEGGSAVKNFSNTNGIVTGTVDDAYNIGSVLWMKREIGGREGRVDLLKKNKYFAKIFDISSNKSLAIANGYTPLALDKNFAIHKGGDRPEFAVGASRKEIDTTIRIDTTKGMLCLDIDNSLLDLWLSLMGYSTDEQKADWCNEHIPPFEGTYDLWIGAIKDEHILTARCGEYVSALTFKTVFNNRSVATQPYVDNALRDKADVITNPRRGESPLVCTDSDEEPLLGMTIFGKTEQFTTEGHQLFDKSKISAPSTMLDNSTGLLVDAGDSNYYVTDFIPVERGKTYCSSNTYSTRTWLYDTSKNPVKKIEGYGLIENVPNDGFIRRTFVASNSPIDKFMFNEGSEVAPYEPYTGGKASPSPKYPQEIKTAGASGSIETKVGGANLIPKSVIENESAENPTAFYSTGGYLFKKGQTYTVSTIGITNAFQIKEIGSNELLFISGYNVRSFTFTPTKDFKGFILFYKAGTAVDKGIMMNYGSTNLDYEPFKPIQTLVSATPNGLNGIGGVYDEKNYETEKQTKRFGMWTFDGSADEGWVENYSNFLIKTLPLKAVSNANIANIRSDSFVSATFDDISSSKIENGIAVTRYGYLGIRYEKYEGNLAGFKASLQAHPITVVAELASPIITDIPAEEMAQYKALHSNNPVTTVWNPDGTEIYMKYRAETSRIVKQMARDIIKNEAIYEMGENYIKYANGTMSCWGHVSFNKADDGWSNYTPYLYLAELPVNQNFPLPFVAKPETVNVTFDDRANNGIVNAVAWDEMKISSVKIIRNAKTRGSYDLSWEAIGKWK